MRRVKKISMGVPFAKKGEELKNGDIITILDEGQLQEGQFGEQFNIMIKLANGEDRALTLNQTSENNLIDAYGEDSIIWVNKKVKVFLEKKIINGKRVIIAYLADPKWERDEFGDFVSADNSLAMKNKATDPNEEIPVIDESWE